MNSRKLFETEDIVNAAKNKKFSIKGAAKILMMITNINKINKIYNEFSDHKGVDFINALFDELEIKYQVSQDELSRIPQKGPFVIVSNHPYGGIDGLLLIKVISEIRPDFKILNNYLVSKIEVLNDHLIDPNPFDPKANQKDVVKGLKKIYQHIEDGGCIGMFPAIESATYDEITGEITDQPWRLPVTKLIKRLEVPVITLHFKGNNSKLYHFLGMIHPRLKRVKFPNELLNKKNRTINIRISNPISVKDQKDFPEINRYTRYLRAKTYAMGSTLEIKKFFIPTITRQTKEEKIIDPIPNEIILSEVEFLKKEFLLFSSSNFKVICAPSMQMPNVMNEIGRLREITFRQVGEGTNKSIDIDEFDLYYHQLFIWDDTEQKIVGAYRIGKGKEITETYGITGFYLQSLFRMDQKFMPVLRESLELGRSFIVQEYQRKPMSLFLLWKGILYFLLKNTDYRYLIGPVSISNSFTDLSKGVIVEFIKRHCYNHELAKLIKPRKEFRLPLKGIDAEILLDNSGDIGKLDKLIEDLETSNTRVPVLLKKYLKLNGKIISFNVDPKFNNCVDGLLILDLFDVPMDIVTSLSKEIKDESILSRFSVS